MQLSKSEEQLMEYIWQQDTVFLKDLIDSYPGPKPASTTVATLLKRMQDKGFVAYKLFGNSRQYYALVTKQDYFAKHVKGIINNYFDGSAMQFASFFTKATNLTKNELEDLKKIVEGELKKKNK